MSFAAACLLAGGVLVVMALSGSVLKRLPLTASMFYLALGFILGPTLFGVIDISMLNESAMLERITEVAVLISLFTAGLKLRVPLDERRWILPVRLATLSMVITIALVAACAYYVFGLPLGAAILLGAILAPTDPVLASDVQVSDPYDLDRLRFSLTGEAGLNDGTAFPFVMLGLGLLGLHDLGAYGWRWWAIDLIWAVAGGLAVGAILGTLIGNVVLYLRREHREALGLDEFLTLGLIAISYGAALLLHTYGFLAVFAAGIALRRVEMAQSGSRAPDELRELSNADAATNPESAPAAMAQGVLSFNEQLERIAEVAVVVLLGSLLGNAAFPEGAWWMVAALLLVIRPLAVFLGVVGSRTSTVRRSLIGWFGIRGVGSLYYLAYAIQHGLPTALASQLAGITLAAVAVSIIVHGISVTPLMHAYARR
ncbi:MAG TPA: sodium:proton antiporter [Burkholderiales bacterium]|nr:sodium:proton antiporter [Burkholderiales bacterium]